MSFATNYCSVENLSDGRLVEIRALRPGDRGGLLAAVDRSSAQSLYRRFFGVRRNFTEREIKAFSNVNFIDHVALVAVMEEHGRPAIVGGGRYIVLRPGRAEVAFTVIDEYQGKGIGKKLMHHLVDIARAAGIQEFIADVLPENTRMLNVFAKSSLHSKIERKAGVVEVTLRLVDP